MTRPTPPLSGSAAEAGMQQPPCNNDYVAEGCEKFDTREHRALKTILAMCDAPYFDSKRRWAIREVAAKALK